MTFVLSNTKEFDRLRSVYTLQLTIICQVHPFRRDITVVMLSPQHLCNKPILFTTCLLNGDATIWISSLP